jgi:starch synthase
VRIAYLFDRPLPATETDSEQALQTICALARRGHELLLVVPKGKSAADLGTLLDYYQVRGDFELVTLDNALYRWSTGRKWLHAANALRQVEALRPELIYTRNFPALTLATRGTLPFVYETYRPWFRQFPPLRPAFGHALGHDQCLGAVLHSQYAADCFAALGIDPDRLAVIHNGHDPTRFAGTPDKRLLRQQLGLPLEATIATYAGHVNATKGLDVLLKVAGALPDVRFLLVGSSGEGLIERLARRHVNVQVVPWQPFDRTVQYLLASDLLLQPPSSVPLKLVGNTVLPMKVILYLAAGRPIVAPNTPDIVELLRHEQNALLVPPGDSSATAAAISRIMHEPELAARIAQGAKESAAGLTWDARGEKIERFINHRMACRSA